MACGETEAPPPPRCEVIVAGDGSLRLCDDGNFSLVHADSTLLNFDVSSWQLGVQSVVADDTNFDPYRLFDPSPLYTVSDDLHFASVTGAAFSQVDPSSATLQLQFGPQQHAVLTAEAVNAEHFTLQLVPTLGAERVAYLRVRPVADASEGFYGLGEYFDEVNHRGAVRAMQLEVAGANTTALESGYNEAHVPVPFLVGTRGWGMFVASPFPGVFAVATNGESRVDATFGTGTFSSDGLDVHLYSAEHPLDVTKHYFDTTGKPKLPARWALGPWVWRDENDDQAQVESDLETLRDLDLPTNGYWIDRPYASAVNSFDFDQEQFPNPSAMYDKMKALGFRTALWHTPYLDSDAGAVDELREHAEAEGYYPLEAGPKLNGWGPMLDLTNDDAVAWWRDQLEPYRQLGVEGYKLDYAEDVLAGAVTKRFKWLFADGSDERTQHSQFQRHYHETYAAMLPEDGGFLLCRAGTYGDQQSGAIIWPGDLDANFAKHGEERKDAAGDSYVSVGGLPASVVAALTLGPSGFLFYGSDTGGYRHCPPDNETFSRWFEQTSLSTVMQIGTSCNDVAWEPTEGNGFDDALLERYRTYTRLHLRLFPYVWSYAQRAVSDGRPIMRALGLAYPQMAVHPNDVYLLGDALLVAPVLERGVTKRVVPFPPGEWVHWFTGELYDGGTEPEVQAPIGRLPLFLSSTTLVPLLRPTIETLSPTTDPERVDSYATTSGKLYVRGVAKRDASFELFDGTRLSQQSSGELRYEPGDELNQGAIFELLVASRPKSVALDGAQLSEVASLAALEVANSGWFHDGDTLWVYCGAAGSCAVAW